MKMIKKQLGFTLLELMIALVLGLIITAAALQLFITAQSGLNLQKAMSDLQESGNFGLNYLLKDIRKANLDAMQSVINDQNLYGGIVFTGLASYPTLTAEQKKTAVANLPVNIGVAKGLLTRGDGLSVASGNQWTGASNVDGVKSDQLVIQYKAISSSDVDCEGGVVSQTEINEGLYIVQRYYIKKDGNNFNLMCDAGRFKTNVTTLPTAITGYGGGGEIIIKNVEHFHVLLGVKDNTADSFHYITIKDYMGTGTNDLSFTGTPPAPPAPRSRIMSIQIGMLVRGNDVANDPLITNTQVYRILDQDVELTDDAKRGPRYLRQVVSQTIALRNGYGLTESL